MNVLVRAESAEAARAKRKRRRPRRDDQEFLAPDLEILETPPSPVGLALLLLICGFAIGGVTWAHFGRVDIIATAQGKLEPLGKVNVIQPLEMGKVAVIHATNGRKVRAGDMLLSLDNAELTIQHGNLSRQRDSLRVEILRRQAAIATTEAAGVDPSAISASTVDWQNLPEELARREQALLQSELAALRNALFSVEAQIAAKATNTQSITSTLKVQRRLVATARELAIMRQTLANSQAGSRADWLAAEQAVEAQEVALANQQGTLASEAAAVKVLRADAQRLRGDYVAENRRQVVGLQKQLDELDFQLEQLSARLGRLVLRSPIDGIVQASTITTLGQVVMTGEDVMRVVPDGPLQIQAYLSNQDVGFVKVGQSTTIKVMAFPYTQYGTIKGVVTSIANDAVTADEAKSLLAEDKLGVSRSPTSGVLGALVFPVTVEIEDEPRMNDGRLFALSPGMSVIVEADTGSRSILEYLFSPVVEVSSTALRER